MSLPFSPSRRRAIQWMVVLLGVLVIAMVGIPRAILPSAAAAPVAADDDLYPWLAPCSKLSAHRLLETAVPVTQAPPTAAPSNPAPTATPRPAPQEDRVGFPAGYGETFRLLVVLDRPDNKQVRAICANEVAAGISPGRDFPYGSVLVMETWRARQDSSGQPILDANGHYIRETLTGVFVMRKEEGFGTAYGPDRGGEWEYVAYRPDGTTMTAPARTNACASCHLRQAGAAMTRTWGRSGRVKSLP